MVSHESEEWDHLEFHQRLWHLWLKVWSVRSLSYFPKQFTVRGSQCFKEWSPSGSRPACLPLPFICLPVLFICLPGWVLVVGFPAGLSPASFHVFPTSFHLSPTSFHLSPTSFHLSLSSFHLSPRLGACGFVSHFFSFVSQAGCLWSGSRLACLPLPVICFPLLFICLPRPFICLPILFISLPVLFICLPGWVLVVGFPAGLSPASFHVFPTSFHLSPTSFSFVSQAGSHFLHLSPTSFHLSPRLGGCGRVPSWLVSHFLSFASHFFSFVSQFFQLSPGWVLVVGFPAGLPLPLGWVLVVGFPAGLSPTSFYLFPTSFHLSPRLGAWVSGRLVSHFLAFVSNFCPKQFTVRGSQFFLKMCHCWCPPISTGHVAFLIYHFSPRSTAGVRPFPLAMQHVYSFVSRVCHWCCRPFPLAM